MLTELAQSLRYVCKITKWKWPTINYTYHSGDWEEVWSGKLTRISPDKDAKLNHRSSLTKMNRMRRTGMITEN